METSSCSIGREVERIWNIVPDIEPCGLKVHDGADEHDTVEGNAVSILKLVNETCSTGCAVGFPRDVLRTPPPILFSEIDPNELGDGLNVFAYPMKILRAVVLLSTRVSRCDRINEYKV